MVGPQFGLCSLVKVWEPKHFVTVETFESYFSFSLFYDYCIDVEINSLLTSDCTEC